MIPITFNNGSEMTRANHDPNVPDLAAVLQPRMTGIVGLCEVPLNDGRIGGVADGDSALTPLVASLQEASAAPLHVRVVPLHAAFMNKKVRLSGLALVTPYPITDANFHKLESPPLVDETKGWSLDHKGVLRCTLDIGGRNLTICVLQLPPAHRFASRLDAPVFSGMRQSLAAAIRGADVVVGDFNNRGVGLPTLRAGLDRFTPALEGATRLGVPEQVDWILFNRSTFAGVTAKEIAWSTSDHAVLMADLPLR